MTGSPRHRRYFYICSPSADIYTLLTTLNLCRTGDRPTTGLCYLMPKAACLLLPHSVYTSLGNCMEIHLFSLLISGFSLSVFICLEREREREAAEEGQRERGTERKGDRGSEAGSVLTAERLIRGPNSRTVRSRPEPKSDP